ncbi:MAG: hypothetical protein H7Z16_00410 [Pyrinomonadaceae bacterium]|nr:hypothetical protein [Pyrinomonadaceae bacterium]
MKTRPPGKKHFGLWTLNFGLVLILLSAASVFAQDNKCALKLSALPQSADLFGFRPGMTPDQVKVRVPQIVFGRMNEFGVAQTSISPDFDPRFDKASFAGIRTVSLDFLDNRLTSIWLGHDGTFKWQTVADYVKGISQSLRLPNAWTSWKTRGQRLVCADFEMTVTMVGEGPSFRIIDSSAEQVVAARRQAKEELESAGEEAADEIVADKDGKVYYAEGCQPVKEIKETNRVVFKSVEDAEKAGYKLAKECQ